MAPRNSTTEQNKSSFIRSQFQSTGSPESRDGEAAKTQDSPLPAITRKTDKGLPQCLDTGESDEFLLLGAEDLFPILKSDRSRLEDDTRVPDYTIHRYWRRIDSTVLHV